MDSLLAEVLSLAIALFWLNDTSDWTFPWRGALAKVEKGSSHSKFHVAAILEKLGAVNHPDAIAIARREGLVLV